MIAWIVDDYDSNSWFIHHASTLDSMVDANPYYQHYRKNTMIDDNSWIRLDWIMEEIEYHEGIVLSYQTETKFSTWHRQTQTHTQTYVYTIYTYAYMHMSIHIYAHVYLHTCIHTYIHACMHIYIHMLYTFINYRC